MKIILGIDNFILDFIYSLKNPVMDFLMPKITSLGNVGFIWIAICIICLFFKKTRTCGITMAVGLILSLIVCNAALKNIFDRIRPFEANNIKELLIAFPKDSSFPSGHSSASFASAVIIFHFNKKWGVTAVILATLIAFSRLYLYVHYPSDVLGGVIIGSFLGFVSVSFVKRYMKKI